MCKESAGALESDSVSSADSNDYESLNIKVKTWIGRAFSTRYLLVTNIATGTTIFTIGDFLHQKALPDEKKGNIDWRRTLRVAASGLCIAPINHFYYKWLDKTIVRGSRGLIVGKKLVIDTATSPVIAAIIVTTQNVVDGSTVSQGFSEYRQKFLHFMALDVALWVPVQVVNFWLVPPSFRVLFVSVAALVDSFIFAHIKQGETIRALPDQGNPQGKEC